MKFTSKPKTHIYAIETGFTKQSFFFFFYVYYVTYSDTFHPIFSRQFEFRSHEWFAMHRWESWTLRGGDGTGRAKTDHRRQMRPVENWHHIKGRVFGCICVISVLNTPLHCLPLHQALPRLRLPQMWCLKDTFECPSFVYRGLIYQPVRQQVSWGVLTLYRAGCSTYHGGTCAVVKEGTWQGQGVTREGWCGWWPMEALVMVWASADRFRQTHASEHGHWPWASPHKASYLALISLPNDLIHTVQSQPDKTEGRRQPSRIFKHTAPPLPTYKALRTESSVGP